MAFKRGYKKSESRILADKSAQIYIVVLLFIISCSTSKKIDMGTNSKVYNKEEGEVHQLTFEGENSQSYFSPINNKLLYVRKIDKTLPTQIYEKNLVTKQDKRITFNIGENTNPQYHPYKSWLIYASTTDEQTEDHQIPCHMDKNYGQKTKVKSSHSCENLPYEIYISAEDGSDIKRITKQKGSDTHPVFARDGNSFYYAHNVGNIYQVFQFNLNSGKQNIVYTTPEVITALSTSEKYLAIAEGRGAKNKLTVLKLQKFEKHFSLEQKNILDVQLHPKEDLALISAKIQNNTDIYLLNFKENCLSRLTYDKADDTQPSFGPSLKTYFFTSNRSKTSQIFSSFIKENLECIQL